MYIVNLTKRYEKNTTPKGNVFGFLGNKNKNYFVP